MPRTCSVQSRPKSASTMIFDEACNPEKVLLIREECSSTLKVILGQMYNDFAHVQLCWLQETIQSNRIPDVFTTASYAQLRDYVRKNKHSVPKRMSREALEKRVADLYVSKLTTILQQPIPLNLTLTSPRYSNRACAHECLMGLLRQLQCEQVRLVVVEVFAFLCQRLFNVDQYDDLVNQSRWSTEPEILLQAQKFVLLLIQETPDMATRILNYLSQTYPQGIPPTTYRLLCRVLPYQERKIHLLPGNHRNII